MSRLQIYSLVISVKLECLVAGKQVYFRNLILLFGNAPVGKVWLCLKGDSIYNRQA